MSREQRMGGKRVRQKDWLEEKKYLVKMAVLGIIETGCLQNRCLQVPTKHHAVSRVHLIELEDYGLIFPSFWPVWNFKFLIWKQSLKYHSPNDC